MEVEHGLGSRVLLSEFQIELIEKKWSERCRGVNERVSVEQLWARMSSSSLLAP